MAVNRDVIRAERALYDLHTVTLDAQTEAIIRAWVVAWDQVSDDVEAALLDLAMQARDGRVTASAAVRSQRLQTALARMADALEQAVGGTNQIVTTQLLTYIEQAAQAQVDMLAAQLPAHVGATVSIPVQTAVIGASSEQIAAITRRVTERITKQGYHLAREAQVAIRRQLLRGMTVGLNPREAARRAMRGIKDKWNGGAWRAQNIARTEMLDAHRQAALEVEKRNADIVAGWQWEAHLDARTCRACMSMHGRQFEAGTPGPEGHQSCRCARLTLTKSWAELGFEGIKEPSPISQDAEAFFGRLSEKQQRRILGDKGYAAWKAGEYPMSAWATRQKNAGWRDSYVTTRPPTID